MWGSFLKGLSPSEEVAKLTEVLRDVAKIEGTVTMEKCKKAKKRLEKDKDMEGIDTSNIIESSSRRRSAALARSEPPAKRPKHEFEDEDEDKDHKEGSSEGSDGDSDGSRGGDDDDDDDDEDARPHHRDEESDGYSSDSE